MTEPLYQLRDRIEVTYPGYVVAGGIIFHRLIRMPMDRDAVYVVYTRPDACACSPHGAHTVEVMIVERPPYTLRQGTVNKRVDLAIESLAKCLLATPHDLTSTYTFDE